MHTINGHPEEEELEDEELDELVINPPELEEELDDELLELPEEEEDELEEELDDVDVDVPLTMQTLFNSVSLGIVMFSLADSGSSEQSFEIAFVANAYTLAWFPPGEQFVATTNKYLPSFVKSLDVTAK